MTTLELMKNIDSRWEQLTFALIVLALAFVVARIFRYIAERLFRKAAEQLRKDPTRPLLFKNGVFVILLVFILVIFRSMPTFPEFGATLAAGAGRWTAVVRFSSQQAFPSIHGDIEISCPYRYSIYKEGALTV